MLPLGDGTTRSAPLRGPSLPRRWSVSGAARTPGPTGSDSRQRGLHLHVPTGRGAGPLIFVVVALCYLGLAWVVVWLTDPGLSGAGLWPAAGLSLAALLLVPRKRWGWVVGAVASAELGGNLLHGYPVWASLGWTLGNCVEPVVGALLLGRFGNRHGALAPTRQLLLFVGLAVIAAPVLGALIGGTTSVLAAVAESYAVLPRYFIGDALGVLIIAPLFLTWGMARVRRSVWETGALSALSVLVAVVVFGNRDSWTASTGYLLIPFFTWTALRYGVRGVAWISFAITAIGSTYTARGEGPFADPRGSLNEPITLLQLFLVIVVVTTYVLAAVVSQLSGRAQVENALRHQAFHDTLTGLPNRAYLADVFERCGAAGSSGGDGLALLVCDIDHLKVVNDASGHSAGDQLIATIARCLQESVRPDDLVARISGDEFVVVLRGVNSAAAADLCERIMARVGQPVLLTGHKATTPSVSIGVAVGEPGSTSESVFNGADAALYEAKKGGRGRTVVFDDALRKRVRDDLQIEVDLPAALSEGQIYCMHQPEIELATGALFSFESLARWRHPERGLIGADKFIPAVDATGNSGLLFETILEQTLNAQQRWATNVGFLPSVAVNLSASQLADPHLPETVALALTRADAPADRLWLELTETGLASRSTLTTLIALHDLGVHLALDDFGTGWSSMARLSQYPWDLLKIDRSFVAALGVDPRAEHLVRAMIVMAHALGIKTVGEGVETPEQLALLTDLGCDIVQGFLFSAAVSAREAIDMVDDAGLWTGYPVVTPALSRPAV